MAKVQYRVRTGNDQKRTFIIEGAFPGIFSVLSFLYEDFYTYIINLL